MGTHNLEHAVSAVSDIPHAGGLAILFPHWMRKSVDVNPARGAQLAVRVFGVDGSGKTDRETALEGIDRLASFWLSSGHRHDSLITRLAPIRLNKWPALLLRTDRLETTLKWMKQPLMIC